MFLERQTTKLRRKVRQMQINPTLAACRNVIRTHEADYPRLVRPCPFSVLQVKFSSHAATIQWYNENDIRTLLERVPEVGRY